MVPQGPENGVALDVGGLANCFSADASPSEDCSLFQACIDVTLNASLSLAPNPGDPLVCNDPTKTAFVFGVSSVTGTMTRPASCAGPRPRPTMGA